LRSPPRDWPRSEQITPRGAHTDTARSTSARRSAAQRSSTWHSPFYERRRAGRAVRRQREHPGRVLRLVASAYLAQCYGPWARRPKLLFPSSMSYDHDARTPQSVRAISPDALESWSRDSILNELGPFSNILQAYLDAEVGTFDHFTLKMAERAFTIERG